MDLDPIFITLIYIGLLLLIYYTMISNGIASQLYIYIFFRGECIASQLLTNQPDVGKLKTNSSIPVIMERIISHHLEISYIDSSLLF